MARLYYGHVNSQGIKLHYYRTGDDKPPVIFLHGLLDNALCWSRLAFRLEPFYDVILVDACGHGLSSPPPEQYPPQARASDVAAIIEVLHLEKPQIIGHSMGAETAVFFAALYPKLAGSIILEDPPFWENQENETFEARQIRLQRFHEQLLEFKGKMLDELIETGKKLHPNWAVEDLFQWGKSKHQTHMKVFQSLLTDRQPWQYYMRQIKYPILLITGDPTAGAIVTPDVARSVVKMCPKTEIVNIPGTGHSIRRDNLDIFYETVKRFLRKQTKW